MKAPNYLKGEARKYWYSHAKRLADAGILTDADVESFALLCMTWGMIQELQAKPGAEHYREMTQYNNLIKQYLPLAKQFGMLPRDRKASKIDAPNDPAELLAKKMNEGD